MLAAEATPWLQPLSYNMAVASGCVINNAALQGWSCARRAGSQAPPLLRRASIQRRLMLPELPAVEIASPAAPIHRDWSSARPDGAGCCRFDRRRHVVTQRQRRSLARRCQPEPVLRAGDELWRWHLGAGTMQEDHTRSLLKSQGSSRSCRQDTALRVHCLPLRPQRGGALVEEEPGWPCRAEIEDSDIAILLYLVARVTYIISQ